MTGLKTIIYLPIVGYQTLRQRAQHLIAVAGQRKIRVFHVNPHIGMDSRFLVRATEDRNVYEVFLKRAAYPERGMNNDSVLQSVMYLASLLPEYGGQCIIWVNISYWSPIAIPLKKVKPETILIYDILDVFSEFDDLIPYQNWLLQEHHRLLKECTLCAYTAKELLNIYPEIKDVAHLHVPNGINIEDFDTEI